VHGIDAHIVEVEVDVGSARMEDFNVVGLPDNAVKESRQRVKAALRNCGFEFPYGQGVTINLAPPDLRKEGSGFDLPMALGLAGCQAQFFGKALDPMMFLGELSLDGGVRAVRGALSTTLAAKDLGLKAMAVPETNAREAAVVDGIDVFALKLLPQAVDLVNSPESFQPIRVDARTMLSEAARYSVDLRTCTDSNRRSVRWKWRARVGTTYLSGRRGRAKRCWRSGSRRYCRRCRWKKRFRRRGFTAGTQRNFVSG
jgi:magnesium chelatase family protein